MLSSLMLKRNQLLFLKSSKRGFFRRSISRCRRRPCDRTLAASLRQSHWQGFRRWSGLQRCGQTIAQARAPFPTQRLDQVGNQA